MAQIALASLLDQAIGHLWPARRDQEALLDLGERKGWGTAERSAAVGACARWLIENRVAPAAIIPADVLRVDAAAAIERLTRHAPRADAIGVAQRIAQVAPVLGVATPKTLANTLSGGLQPRRPDHRLLMALDRSLCGPAPPFGFSARSEAVMAQLCARLAGHLAIEQPDALDALWIVSILALWQRRRDPRKARGNRGAGQTRRLTPKPVARLAQALMGPAQLSALVDLAERESTPAIALLGIEAALTRIHLSGHGDRRDARLPPDRLSAALVEIIERASLEGEQAMLRYRLDVSRAWRSRATWPTPPAAIAAHPYVHWSVALARQTCGGALSLEALRVAWQTDWPGKAMLAPIIRHRLMREA